MGNVHVSYGKTTANDGHLIRGSRKHHGNREAWASGRSRLPVISR